MTLNSLGDLLLGNECPATVGPQLETKVTHKREYVTWCSALWESTAVREEVVVGGGEVAHLVLEQEQAAEEAVKVGRQQGQVDRGGAGSLNHHRHEAVQAEHAGAESDVQKPCGRRERTLPVKHQHKHEATEGQVNGFRRCIKTAERVCLHTLHPGGSPGSLRVNISLTNWPHFVLCQT